MFESSLLTALRNDDALAALVSTHEGAPAIFSEFAPETAEFPYITFRISRNADDRGSPAVQRFSVFVDYWDYGTSATNSRVAAERIEFTLDMAELDHDRYSCIRFFFFAGSSVPEEDPRAIHYNLQFSARAGRKKWIDQLNDIVTTTTTTTAPTTTTSTTSAP